MSDYSFIRQLEYLDFRNDYFGHIKDCYLKETGREFTSTGFIAWLVLIIRAYEGRFVKIDKELDEIKEIIEEMK